MFTVKLFDPYLSQWFIVAHLSFLPSQNLSQQLVEFYCNLQLFSYNRIRIYKGYKVVKEFIYECD